METPPARQKYEQHTAKLNGVTHMGLFHNAVLDRGFNKGTSSASAIQMMRGPVISVMSSRRGDAVTR
jgi:hypothetical protein